MEKVVLLDMLYVTFKPSASVAFSIIISEPGGHVCTCNINNTQISKRLALHILQCQSYMIHTVKTIQEKNNLVIIFGIGSNSVNQLSHDNLQKYLLNHYT